MTTISLSQSNDWIFNDPLCEGIISILKGGKVETRDFLRPIFKWLKQGGKYFNPEKVFLYIEWMIQIRDIGEERLEISKQSHIQPKYAYNTVVTMCQRNSDSINAMKAYNLMIQHSFDPDVFTMTALLDVIGRNGRFLEAIEMYRIMMKSEETLPNVVTFVTLIRVASNLSDKLLAKQYVRILLEDAHSLVHSSSFVQLGGQDGNVVISIYNAALSACVRLSYFEYFGIILSNMQNYGVEWTMLTYDIVSKYYYRNRNLFLSIEDYLFKLEEMKSYSITQKESLYNCIQKYVIEKDTNTSERKFYAGCLGSDAPSSLRISVMVHDVNKLLDRLEPDDTSQLTESDFVTLLHQCRKRRWSDQINYIITQMDLVSTEGIPTSGIAPVSHLIPTRITYEAALDGYFHTNYSNEAWKLVQRILDPDNIIVVDFDEHLLSFIVRGFLRCGNEILATKAFLLLLKRDVVPTVEIVVRTFRGLGKNLSCAFSILTALLTNNNNSHYSQFSESGVIERLILTLLESCSVLSYPQGIEEFYYLVEQSNFSILQDCFHKIITTNNITFSIICIMAASNQVDVIQSLKYLWKWQSMNLIPPLTIYYSLTLEFFNSCLDGSSLIQLPPQLTSLPYRGFLKNGALKYVDSKINYLHQIFTNVFNINKATTTTIQNSELTLESKSKIESIDTLNSNNLIYEELKINSILRIPFMDEFDNNNFNSNEIPDSFYQLNTLNVEDMVLNHYIKVYQQYGHCIFIQLYLQHLNMKMLLIRSKQDKLNLISSVSISIANIHFDSFGNFLYDIIHYCSTLEISSKQQSKIISLIFNSLNSEVHKPTIHTHIEILLIEKITIRPSIDILKELFRQLNNNLTEMAKIQLTNRLLFNYLQDKTETPIRIVQMLKPFELYEHVDYISYDNAIVDCFLEDQASNWMALTTYIGDHPDKIDACTRICRLLITKNSSDLVLKLLTKFQIFSESEFDHLFKPSEKLFLSQNQNNNNNSNNNNNDGNNIQEANIPVFHLSQFSQKLVFVNNLETLDIAMSVLPFNESNECDHGGIIALDSEWRPFTPYSKRNKCSLLQIATFSHVLLFDLIIMEPCWINDMKSDDNNNNKINNIDEEELIRIHQNYSHLMSMILSDQRLIKIGYFISFHIQLFILLLYI